MQSCSSFWETSHCHIQIFNALAFMTISAYLFFRRQSSCEHSFASHIRSFSFTYSSALERWACSFLRSDWAMMTSWSRELMSATIIWSWYMCAQIASLANCNCFASSIAILPLFFDCPTLDYIVFSCKSFLTQQGFCLSFYRPLLSKKLQISKCCSWIPQHCLWMSVCSGQVLDLVRFAVERNSHREDCDVE